MPIRTRISNPFSEETKRFGKRMREGAPPPVPKKPDAQTREPLVKALMGVPVGKRFKRSQFFREIADHYMVDKYVIWFQTLYIMVGYKNINEDYVECTGATIGRINPNKRGVRPMLRLQGEQKTWFTQILRWIEETEFDG
jgi:hypothetical protein